MVKQPSILLVALAASFAAMGAAADTGKTLVLAENGKSKYEIVLPDKFPDDVVAQCLRQTARLVQTAFHEANGAELSIATESERDKGKPAIFLGDTGFARNHGADVDQLHGWNYVVKTVGDNLIIAGKDEPPPPLGDLKINAFYRLGTLKAAIDFLRTYAGTYFLFPTRQNTIPSHRDDTVADWVFTETAAIEYKKAPVIQIPANLDIHKKFFINYHKRTAKYCLLYDLACNTIPPVNDAALHHTYGLAVGKEYWDSHPEYFALLGNERMKPSSHDSKVQHCLANPEFQDALTRWHGAILDKGFNSVHILQSDGFRPCQCPYCKAWLDTDDWGEKLWASHCGVAERLKEKHPGKDVVIHAYGPVHEPPKLLKSFPENVSVYTMGTSPTGFDKFAKLDIPGGFYTGIHNWIANKGSRYTPMRTPQFVEKQVKRFHKHNVKGVSWDGFCYLYGLEGPTLYVYGRMFDDPENLKAKDILREYCDAAFAEAGPAMLRFYDRLYHGIELYAQFLGTECPGWSYTDIYGRGHKHIESPYQLLGFLYTPKLLSDLESNLTAAEKKAKGDKVKARLALVRREFDYVKALATVVYLYQAYQLRPDKVSRDRLLDAIDDRNALIEGWYDYIAQRDKGKGKGKGRYDRATPMPGWATTLFPPHGFLHMRLNFNSYGNPFKDTCFNWDTAAMRNAPLPGTKHIDVPLIDDAVTIDSPLWKTAKAQQLSPPPGQKGEPRETTAKVLCGPKNLFILMESELPPGQRTFPALGEDADLTQAESMDVYLAPVPGQETYYWFAAGPNPESRFDAVNRVLANPLDPAYGADDATWDGEWTRETRVEPERKRWRTMLTIPFATLGVERPKPDESWRINLGATHPIKNGVDKAFWSMSGEIKKTADKSSLGDLVFRDADELAEANIHPSAKFRQKYYAKTFKIPKEWENLPDPLPTPLDSWVFKTDELDKGVSEKWFAVDADESDWRPVEVPSFWRESGPHTQGFGWYRITFKIPADWKGRSLRLMFAGVDEQAWVYVNGKLVKEHTVKSEKATIASLWETPFTVDVKPELLNYGGDNVLAVRVQNDRGSGGLWRPVLARAVESKE